MQKHKLLKELASQQEQILKEQKALDCRYGTGQLPLQPVQMRSHAHKRDVIRKYDHAREVEEAKVTKTMAFLNRRRNSAQLKLDQVAKELAPKSGKKRRDNHQHFAALEAKQAELKKKLAQVDNEIFKLQANKQVIVYFRKRWNCIDFLNRLLHIVISYLQNLEKNFIFEKHRKFLEKLFLHWLVFVVYSTPSEGWRHGGRPWSPEAGQLPRVWTRGRRETRSRQRASGAKSP